MQSNPRKIKKIVIYYDDEKSIVINEKNFMEIRNELIKEIRDFLMNFNGKFICPN